MTLIEFIKNRSTTGTPIGDLANDILGDRNFPKDKSEEKMIEYLAEKTRRRGTYDIFQEFLAEYRN